MQIKADLHTHTIASTHAYSTVQEMTAAAAETSLELLAVTDHGIGSPDAPHRWHFHNYKILPRKINGVWLLKGVEANIMDEDGTLDMNEHELSFCEWVIASYHTSCVTFERTPELILQGYRGACENPSVDVIGHPTTDYFPIEHEAAVRLFKESGKLVELNESSICWKPGAMKNAYSFYRLCRDYAVPLVVNTDAHFSEQVGKTPAAAKLLDELNYPRDLIVNLDASRVMEMAAKKRGIVFA